MMLLVPVLWFGMAQFCQMRTYAAALTGATFRVRKCQAIVHPSQSSWFGFLSKQTLAFGTFLVERAFFYLFFMTSYKYAQVISSEKEQLYFFFVFYFCIMKKSFILTFS